MLCETRGPCVSPPKAFGGDQEGSSPLHKREPVPGGWSNLRPLRLSSPRGDQEGSPPTILQEPKDTGKPKQTQTDDPRPHRGRSRGLSQCRSGQRFPSPLGPVTKATPQPKPEGRLDGMCPRVLRGRLRLNASVPSGYGKDTLYDPHRLRTMRTSRARRKLKRKQKARGVLYNDSPTGSNRWGCDGLFDCRHRRDPNEDHGPIAHRTEVVRTDRPL